MGKRKQADNNNTLPLSDVTLNVPEQVLQLEKSSSEQAETSAPQSTPSIIDVTGSSCKRPPPDQSTLNETYSSSGALLLRQPCRTFGRYYSRRSSTNASPSTSTPNLSVKLNTKERTRSSTSVLNAVSADVQKKECGICKKRLKKKLFAFGNYIVSSELSVVAVLVCGHAYHADCLEQNTRLEDKQDPPCPLCLSIR
ncbi:hypothetical protein ACJIZ3_025331 [Penstemon smallii]|uniref:RING-type domain-containing protein n=1 Tax=Penstemon smallii TaxID=265156 RepID=A0ABD3TUN5_9LAMI